MDDPQLIETTLSGSSLFSGLDEEQLGALQQIATRQTAPAGSTIFMLGEEATSLYLLAEGLVALTLPLAIRGQAADITLEEKGRGQVIAWSALVAPHKLTLSARARETTTLIALGREDLQSLFLQQPRLHAATMDRLCQVIGSRVALLEALVIRDLQRAVAERTR